MATVEVLDWDNKSKGKVELSPEVFESEVRLDILHGLVKWQLAKKRSGTHSALTKGEVRGGGKKPFKQKGTGNARQGSIRSPLMPGGGVSFPPKPRSYDYSVPKKVKQLGMRSALSHLFKTGKVKIMDNMKIETGKTKDLQIKLKKLGVAKSVMVSDAQNELLQRASKNLVGVTHVSTAGLNVYDLLKYDHVMIAKDSVADIQKRCGVEK
jgi:large subunit ribosomal protein L4